MAADEIKGFSVNGDSKIELGFKAGIKATVTPRQLDQLVAAAKNHGPRENLVLLRAARKTRIKHCLSS